MKYHQHMFRTLRRLPSLVFLTTFILMLSWSSPASAQVAGKKFSISFKDKSVAQILDFISTKGDYKINYSDDVKNDTLLLTISFEDVDELSAVENLLSHSSFVYNIDGKVIDVFKMKNATQGQYTIRGTVKDKDGLGVPFAIVQIKGTSQGITADIDGNFSMPVEKEEGTITISSVGYDAKTLKYHAGKAMNVILTSSAIAMGEVTVVAYGKRNTREQVGAVASVKVEDLQKQLDLLIMERLNQRELLKDSVVSDAENTLEENTRDDYRFKIINLNDEMGLIRELEYTRLIVDLNPVANIYTQIAGISAGIPQINLQESEYVTHLQNGYILSDLSEFSKAGHYFLDTLKHWNQALIYSIDKIRQNTGDQFVDKWEKWLEEAKSEQ